MAPAQLLPSNVFENENHSREHSRYIAHCLNFRYMAYRNYYRGEGGISIAQRPPEYPAGSLHPIPVLKNKMIYRAGKITEWSGKKQVE